MTTQYPGSGDPARSLALLWRTRERSSRKGKPDLSVDRIVRTAIEIADGDGLAALSMRRVAERLGVGTMSLYTYVPGKAVLLDVMVDTVLGEAVGSEEVPPGRWRANLERVARNNRSLYLRHPWLLQVAMSRPVLGPNTIAKYDHELSGLAGVGLDEVEMDSVLTLVLGFVHGAARGAVDDRQVERHTGMTDEQWWSAHSPVLARVLPPGRFPTASRVGSAAAEAYGGAFDPEHAFEFGLQRVLDGIEVFVAARSGDAG